VRMAQCAPVPWRASILRESRADRRLRFFIRLTITLISRMRHILKTMAIVYKVPRGESVVINEFRTGMEFDPPFLYRSDGTAIFVNIRTAPGLYRCKSRGATVATLIVTFNARHSGTPEVYPLQDELDGLLSLRLQPLRRGTLVQSWNYDGGRDALGALVRILDGARDHHDYFVTVIRRIASMMNVEGDDGGILVGNWTGNYSGGTAPFAWVGSAEIITQYMRTGKISVHYGQCWVFAAVMVTFLRMMGLPARALNAPNFDKWNYHVLVEVFYDWQTWIVDATPLIIFGPTIRTSTPDCHGPAISSDVLYGESTDPRSMDVEYFSSRIKRATQFNVQSDLTSKYKIVTPSS
jgi:hypothetical protein